MNHFNPQPKQARKARRANGTKESEIQAAVDRLLTVLGFDYFRIPDAVYIAFKTGRMPNPGLRAAVLAQLRGWPDNAVHVPLYQTNGVKLCLTAFIENKTATGELHGEQKYKGARLGYNICRDVKDAHHVVNVLRRICKQLQDGSTETAS